MSLILHTIFETVKSDFCSLLDYKLRGDTIEIITSIPTLTSSYVSVFVSCKNGIYAVSDGGWVKKNAYETPTIEDSEMLTRIYNQYKDHFKIKETIGPDNSKYYYKTTDKIGLVSALVYDVGHFVSSIINTQNIAFKETEDEEKKLFHNRINGYFRNRFGPSNLLLNSSVKISDTQNIRFNAVVHANATDHYYIMYITGSRTSFFIKDLTEATVNFEIVNENARRIDYFKKLAVVDVSAQGYNKEKSGIYIDKLTSALGRSPVLLRTNQDDFKLSEAIPV